MHTYIYTNTHTQFIHTSKNYIIYYMNESCCMNESCQIQMSHVIYKWVMSQIWINSHMHSYIERSAARCSTLQHTATHYNTLQLIHQALDVAHLCGSQTQWVSSTTRSEWATNTMFFEKDFSLQICADLDSKSQVRISNSTIYSNITYTMSHLKITNSETSKHHELSSVKQTSPTDCSVKLIGHKLNASS